MLKCTKLYHGWNHSTLYIKMYYALIELQVCGWDPSDKSLQSIWESMALTISLCLKIMHLAFARNQEPLIKDKINSPQNKFPTHSQDAQNLTSQAHHHQKRCHQMRYHQKGASDERAKLLLMWWVHLIRRKVTRKLTWCCQRKGTNNKWHVSHKATMKNRVDKGRATKEWAAC